MGAPKPTACTVSGKIGIGSCGAMSFGVPPIYPLREKVKPLEGSRVE